MSIDHPSQLEALKAAGKIVRMMLEQMKAHVRPGVTTKELDEIGAEVMEKNGARSAPSTIYDFPGTNCISVNDEAVHGIPSRRVLREGDLLKLDVTIVKDGFMADAAETVPVGNIDAVKQKLMACARNAFEKSLTAARAGNRVMEIGRIVEREVRRNGFFVIRELEGHGIGRTIHEPPSVPNFADPRARQLLKEGMVLTVEPIIAAGAGTIILDQDGWTIRTADRSPSAHYEHTMVITAGQPILLTA
jgi:methionyl aminopeptidase